MKSSKKEKAHRSPGWAVLLGVLFAGACLAGSMMQKKGYLYSPSGDEVTRACLSGAVYAALCLFLWKAAERRMAKISRQGIGKLPVPAGPGKKFSLVSFLMLYAWNIVCLLAVYPGFFVYDAAEELSMVQTRTFTTHHPLLHVLLLGGTIQAVHKVTGDYNPAIFVYILLQAAVICAALSFLLREVWREAGKKWGTISLIYLLASPVITMFTLCTCKDSLFAAAMTVSLVLLRRYFKDPAGFRRKKRQVFFLGLCLVLMMLLRKNAVYAFAACGIVWIIRALVKKENRKGILLLVLIPLLFYGLSDRALTAALHADESESQEILTVPIQQLARAWQQERGDFTEEETALMTSLMDETDWERYNPKLSDPVKIHFDSSVYRAHRKEFFSMWIRIGMRHPLCYVNAWLGTSYGYWYPWAIVDCYEGNQVYTFTYGKSSFFGFETEKPGERHSLIPALEEYFRFVSLDERAQEVPALHWFLSPGGVFWIWAFVWGYLFRQRRHASLLAHLPVFMTWLTVLPGPCTLPRYVLYLYFDIPLLILELCDIHAK